MGIRVGWEILCDFGPVSCDLLPPAFGIVVLFLIFYSLLFVNCFS